MFVLLGILHSLVLAGGFVLALFLSTFNMKLNGPRDFKQHPTYIKQRIYWGNGFAVFAFVYSYAVTNFSSHQFFQRIGFTNPFFFIFSGIIPVFCTLILFAGPLVSMWYNRTKPRSPYYPDVFYIPSHDGTTREIVQVPLGLTNFPPWPRTQKQLASYLSSGSESIFADLKAGFSSWIWRKNYIFAPALEEWIFRSCICTILYYYGMRISNIVIFAPFFFGISHLIQLVESLVRGESLEDLLIPTLAQIFVAWIFGVLSTYYYLRTTSLFGCFLSHALCNWIGPPNLSDIVQRHPRKRTFQIAYFGGLFVFLMTVSTLTQPRFFKSPFFPGHY